MKIGVVMPIAEDPDRGRPPGYAEIRDLARQAEAARFDSIWVYDHLLFRFPDRPVAGIHEAWTLLPALVEATQRVELGTLVMCTAFRNPAILAKMAATLDEISGGRLILGLGAGWHQPEFDAFGIPFDHRVDRFEEALQIIVPLLREGKVDFRGTYYQAPNCELRPHGPRANGLPILVAAFGPRMLRLTARHADSWNTAWLGHVDALAKPRAALEEACREVGRDPATLEVTVGVSVAYPEPEEPPETTDGPPRALTGTPTEVAEGFLGFEKAGVSHAICALSRPDAAGLTWLGEAVSVFHERKAGR